MNSRQTEKKNFLKKSGWADATVTLLAGDASNRRYDRLVKSDGQRAVLMDAPPDKGEDISPFVKMAQFLCGIGLSAPQVVAEDAHHGFLLLEDLGDELFARHIIGHPESENRLYEAAIDVLAHIGNATTPMLDSYDAEKMSALGGLAFDWYFKGAIGRSETAARDDLYALLHENLRPLDNTPRVVTLRDYHAENLIWLPERGGVARVGLLDFQDAMLGDPSYDLVSVLQDARRDVDPALESAMIARFIDLTRAEAETFETAYAINGAQRNLRIIGVFARLCLRDGKPHYIDLIPRVWALLQRNLAHPSLSEIATLVNATLPVPETGVLENLKSQCAKHQQQ